MRALETILTEKGYVDPAALDLLIETYETKVGPRNGARVVARAWADPAYRARLIADATPAIAELGYAGRQGEHIVALENTPALHNMVVCTLCSCYPWPVLGLPPVWYKSAPYRSKAVKDPRGVLKDFGFELPDGYRHPRLGFHRGNPLSRAADAPRRHRRLERGAPRRSRHPRQHDRHRPAETAARDRLMDGAHDMGGVPWIRSGAAGAERAAVSCRMGAPRLCADAGDGDARRLEYRHVALRPRGPAAAGIS